MFSDHEVHAEIHRIHGAVGYIAKEPYFSISKVMESLFPEVEVIAREMREHARIEVYARPLPSGRRATISYRESAYHSTHRFSIAHELAHWIFDCRRGAVVPAGALCGGRGTAGKATSERRADYFAAELLCPLWRLDGEVDFTIYPDRSDDDAIAQRDQRIQRLASRWNLSKACMARRVFDLAAWRQMSRGR
jgi:hypothetical protein